MKRLLLLVFISAGLLGSASAHVAPDWQNAAVYHSLVGKNGEAFPSEVKVFAIKDETTAYVAVESKLPQMGILRRVMKGAPGNFVSLDDCVLMKFSGRRALAVNANGATRVKGWDLPPEFTCSSTVTNGWWRFECALPLSALGDEKAFDVGRHFALAADGVKPNAWVAKKGSLFPAPDQPALQILAVEGGAREYTVKGRVVNPGKTGRAYHLNLKGKPEASQPMAIIRDLSVPAGGVKDFEFKGAILDDEKVRLTLVDREWIVRPNYNGKNPFVVDTSAADRVSYKFAYFPSFNRFRAQVDVKLLPDWLRDVKGVKVEILNSAGKSLFERVLSVNAKGVADEFMDVPDLRPLTVKSGDRRYRARFVVLGYEGVCYEKEFQRGAFEWEGNTYGLSDTIVPPFTPLQIVNPKTPAREKEGAFPVVRTVLREHALNALGLLAQVLVPAREGSMTPERPLLADGGMRLVATIDGREIVLQGRDFKFEGPENVARRSFTSTFGGGGFEGALRGTWTYEGQLECFFTLKKGAVESLKLVIPVRAEEAKFFHACVDTAIGNPAGFIPAGTGRVWNSAEVKGRHDIIGDFVPYIWVGGSLRGISVYGTNDRGWVIGEGVGNKEEGRRNKEEARRCCQEIVREADGTVKIVLNLVQKPHEFTEPREIHLAFMATPIKPMLENWRAIGPGFLFGGGEQYGAAPTDSIVPYDETDTFWRKMGEARKNGKYDEAWVEQFIQNVPHLGPEGSKHQQDARQNANRCFRSGMYNCQRFGFKERFVWYTNPRGIQYWPSAGRTYCDEWNVFEFMDLDRDFDCMSKRDYCLNPNAAFRDYAAYWYRKMALSLAMDHLYWDVSYPKACWDILGTEAYVLPDGRIQPDLGIFDVAALVKRAATVQAECGRDATGNWVHMTDTAMAQLLAFGGVNFDWEDNVAPHSFQKKYPKDRLIAAVIGRQFGNRVKVIGHYSHTSDERDAWYRRTGTGVMLTHELYWKSIEKVYQEKHKLLTDWGYRQPETRVWNYWNEDEPYPLSVTGGENATLALAKKGKKKGEGGEAAFVISDYSEKGGEFRVRPDVKLLGIGTGFKAYDMEDGSELPVRNGEVVVQVKPCDFRMVVLR